VRERPKVADLMSKDLLVARPTDSVGHAARIMAEAEIRHLPVVDEAGELVGLVSQRDLLACTDTHGRVRDLMSRDVLTVSPETAASEGALLLWQHKIGCVPVTSDDGRLVGILTEADFVRLCYTLLGGRVAIDDVREEERAD
jgi:CBS domain-containing membrane protein